MKKLLAIDPGTNESAYIIWNGAYIGDFGILPNEYLLLRILEYDVDELVIEMVASYGMPVGKSVFETCVWIGRFYEFYKIKTCKSPMLIYRRDVKLHHCNSVRASDTNIKYALIDKYAPDDSNKGKGTKKFPGFFYGFKDDIWQAFAIASYYTETNKEER